MKQLLLSACLIAGSAATLHADDRDFNYMPKGGYASPTGAEYVVASSERKLKPGQKTANLTKLNFAGEAIVQRLTDRAYWAQAGFYSTIFYVGDEGVLIMDPLAFGSGEKILKAIGTVTDKPVTAIIYSHYHGDHIGDVGVYVKAAEGRGHDLRIIASDATEKMLKQVKTKLPLPTETIKFKGGSTKFENLTVRVHGLENPSHDKDSGVWELVGEKVVHFPDLVNPDQMPFMGFAGAESYKKYILNLETLNGMDWDYLSGGHGDVGSHKDVTFVQNYIVDLEQAILTARKEAGKQRFFEKIYNNHQAQGYAGNEFINKKAAEILREKYGNYYGFEAGVGAQIHMSRDTAHH
ncbi:MBL fold metallo-hydrolase [Kordiimonas sp. SCSIO 12603]|uniref:MBL fold metallo-hydrolase n=1 Tax=Kordiimonas sp. SCSIO 12603 TaxID=2829596 RepID=UPI0021078356|nr:MBL fold metallo-hydrolase [Kordiimonas sp. SCSIO 12603]UTW59538.1 MBL fold metallo-hydrolase [Kordiimonas sp. SCSIO 12603]